MKLYFISFLVLPLFLFSQEKVGIYNISFNISQNLLQEYKVKVGQNISSNTIYNTRSIPPFAPYLHDSVRIAIEKLVGEVLSSEANCIYKMNNKTNLYLLPVLEEI